MKDEEYRHLHPDCTGFKYYPNDMTLFEIQEKFFPFDYDGIIEQFHEGFPLSSHPIRMIDRYLKMFSKKPYSFYESVDDEEKVKSSDVLGDENIVDFGVKEEGYNSKIMGLDKSNLLLELSFKDFVARKDRGKVCSQIERAIEIDEKLAKDDPNYEVLSYDQHLEIEFFELICEGVRDAAFEGYLLNLKRKCEKGDYPKMEDDNMPDFEYKTQIAKIAWLHELGVIQHVMNQSKEEGKLIPLRAAKVINSFTGIAIDSLRKAVEAISNPIAEQSFHPFTKNEEFAKDMRKKFRVK